MVLVWFFSLLATDFALKVADCPETEYPVKTLSTQQGCLWYRKDDKFKIPKGKCLRAFWIVRPCFYQLEFIWRQITRGNVHHLNEVPAVSSSMVLLICLLATIKEAGELRQQRHPADTSGWKVESLKFTDFWTVCVGTGLGRQNMLLREGLEKEGAH